MGQNQTRNSPKNMCFDLIYWLRAAGPSLFGYYAQSNNQCRTVTTQGLHADTDDTRSDAPDSDRKDPTAIQIYTHKRNPCMLILRPVNYYLYSSRCLGHFLCLLLPIEFQTTELHTNRQRCTHYTGMLCWSDSNTAVALSSMRQKAKISHNISI